jgi:membrane-bound lytic murein transglycosylase MltF
MGIAKSDLECTAERGEPNAMVTVNLRMSLKKLLSISFFVVVGSLLVVIQGGCSQPAAVTYLSKDDQSSSTPKADTQKDARTKVDQGTAWSIDQYGRAVRRYSARYDLDWRLVLAVMKRESRFSSKAVSNKGAYGLMQIMPSTQQELAEKLGVDNLQTPINNIRAGTFHLWSLYQAFDKADDENRIKLTLAAYNAGLNRILDARDVATYLGDDPNDWEAVRATLPLLSKRYSTLHRRIWESGRPRAGYFRDWRQTQAYVDTIMSYYTEYQLALK